MHLLNAIMISIQIIYFLQFLWWEEHYNLCENSTPTLDTISFFHYGQLRAGSHLFFNNSR